MILEQIKNPKRFLDFCPNKDEYVKEMDYIINKLDEMIEEFGDDTFPAGRTKDNKYVKEYNRGGWTQSFFTGMIWLAYEWTHDEKYKQLGMKHLENFKHRAENRIGIAHHDIGFLYTLAGVAPYKILNDDNAKQVGVMAADLLSERYVDTIKVIDRGTIPELDPETESQFIIDCCMNVPLLYWASEVTGDKAYYDKAYNHMKQAIKYALREDGSTNQNVNLNKITGELISVNARQGYSDDSSWSRGQAWSMYGFILSYAYTKDKQMLDISKKMTNYFLNRLPEDDICGWDLIFTENDSIRDTSAATPAICGMLELVRHLPLTDPDREVYEKAALKMLDTLAKKYTSKGIDDSNSILQHAVYAYHSGANIDEPCIWGDYYYVEAMIRILKVWNRYW